ncbi:MAG: glycoside hydrolase family 36 protein [Candidatus Binataceae bacterium]
MEVFNRGDETARLDELRIEVATGLARDAPARFFKHGYQSWSASGAVCVGAPAQSARDSANRIVRLNHQSEVHRPDDASEACTSELFTIIQSDADGKPLLVGFIGAAHQLTAITAPAPDRVVARALLDGAPLAPGEVREVDPLLVRSGETKAQLAECWARAIGDQMHARVAAPYQRGWCTWYQYFHAISETELRKNVRALKAMRADFPIDVIQLDDGFQAALGDWDVTNEKFPSGLARIAADIRDAGFTAGIWSAPFLASGESKIFADHPDWFIMHEGRSPLRAAYNPNWTRGDDKFAYALDAGNPAFRDHLAALFRRLVADFGFNYLKLDFLYAAAAEGTRSNSRLTRAETLRQGLEAIRQGAGEDAFILGCGCPLGQAIGVVDGMRIGPDVAPYWDASGPSGEPATAKAIDAIIARSFMHRVLWLNDPDCLMLRARDTRLNAEERHTLAAVIAMSAGMLLTSDDMSLIGEDEGATFRRVAELGNEIDRNFANCPVRSLDSPEHPSLRTMVRPRPDGRGLALLVNLGDSVCIARLREIGIGAGPFTVQSLHGGDRKQVESLELAAHSARFAEFPL